MIGVLTGIVCLTGLTGISASAYNADIPNNRTYFPDSPGVYNRSLSIDYSNKNRPGVFYKSFYDGLECTSFIENDENRTFTTNFPNNILWLSTHYHDIEGGCDIEIDFDGREMGLVIDGVAGNIKIFDEDNLYLNEEKTKILLTYDYVQSNEEFRELTSCRSTSTGLSNINIHLTDRSNKLTFENELKFPDITVKYYKAGTSQLLDEITYHYTLKYIPIINGDANNDGRLNNLDILAMRRKILHISDNSITGNEDINGDSAINVLDVMEAKRYILHLKDSSSLNTRKYKAIITEKEHEIFYGLEDTGMRKY